MERKIGEVFTCNGKLYQVVKGFSCRGCAFIKDGNCYLADKLLGPCAYTERTDKTSVIFKLINNMEIKNNQLTIDIPEGMEIDLENSDLTKGIVKFKKKDITYDDCIVCEEWHNFQNFAEWYEENYYEVDGKPTFLDKDILIKGNKIYSPQTCVFVPRLINNLFTKRQNERGLYPIGVEPYKDTNKFKAYCNTFYNGKNQKKYLGLYNTIEDAFKVYKESKEANIKQVADEYKDKIPDKLYEAMYNYKVEITD